MTETWDPLANLLSPTALSGAVLAGTVAHAVGHAVVPAVDYDYADINSGLNVVADIDNPSAWTNLVNLTGGPLAVKILGDDPIALDSGQGSRYMRLQVLIDGVVVYNVKVGKTIAGSNAVRVMQALPYYYCQTSFVIRACRSGPDFATGYTTYLKIGLSGGVHYEKVQKIS